MTASNPAARYCGLGHTLRDVARSLADSDGDEDQDLVLDRLQALARLAGDRAELSRHVHDPAVDADAIAADVDDARFAALLADLAAARHEHTRRAASRILALEEHRYAQLIMDCIASSDEQPGWMLAHRINVLIDVALDSGIGTGLAEQIAHALSCRPDGENADEHEAADAATPPSAFAAA